MFSLLFAKKNRDEGVTVNSLDPGSFLNTRMVKQAYGATENSPESGAITQLFLACAPELKGVTMQYFSQLRPAKANEQAYDVIAQQRLWEVTNKLLCNIPTK